jgi:hypothetical protein
MKSPAARRASVLRSIALVLILAPALPAHSFGKTIRVGPNKVLRTVREAAASAESGDVILVDAGIYSADVATWDKDHLTVRAIGGRAHLRADGAQEAGKGIWVVRGAAFTAENFEFSGAAVVDKNGAGIRLEGEGDVALRNCSFHDNEEGILGHADRIVIENCVFDHNGSGDGRTHNLYVWGQTVTIRHCTIRRAVIGHNIKTRAATNYILYNRITDEADGTGSYSIDVPDCGRTYIIGNVIEQGPSSENGGIVSYGAESDKNVQDLYVVHNTFVNNRAAGATFLQVREGTPARVINNIFYGKGTTWSGGAVRASHNYIQSSPRNAPRFRDPDAYDFHLTPATPRAIRNAGILPGASSTGFDLTPQAEYVHPARGRARVATGPPDLGAFEATQESPPGSSK